MTNVYKINLFTYDMSDEDKNEGHNTEHYQTYCKEEKILGWGWPRENPKPVSTLEEYREDYNASKERKNSPLGRACNQINDMKEGDYCWSRINGEWYLGKIEGDFHFNPLPLHPAFGMYRTCKWVHIENKDFIPGSIIVYSRKDGTVRCVSNEDSFVKYCDFLYKHHENLEEAFNLEPPKDLNFYQLAHTDDLEDLIGLYLQKQCDYLIFPSTNKHGTPDYEFELVRKDGKKHAIIQSKYEGEIDVNKLKEYKKDIYLLNVKDSIDNLGDCSDWIPDGTTECMGTESTYENEHEIFVFDAEKLLKWFCKEENENTKILPQRIQNFLKISKKTS